MEITLADSRSEITPALRQATEAADAFAAAALSPRTKRAYVSQLRVFRAWCSTSGASAVFPVAAETAAAWAAARAMAGTRYATIEQGLAALRTISKMQDLPPPSGAALDRTMRGIARTIKTAKRQAPAVTPQELRRAIAALEGPFARRDRALLTIGYGAALRVSEIAALNVSDISETTEGLRVLIRSSKTDQEGAGVELGIARGTHEITCALMAWRALEATVAGPLFRSRKHGARLTPRAVADVIQRSFARVGLRATGHSLRAGFATAAARAGHGLPAIMRQTRHVSSDVALQYVRKGTIFQDNASTGIGL